MSFGMGLVSITGIVLVQEESSDRCGKRHRGEHLLPLLGNTLGAAAAAGFSMLALCTMGAASGQQRFAVCSTTEPGLQISLPIKACAACCFTLCVAFGECSVRG
jgi:hypothetical protein